MWDDQVFLNDLTTKVWILPPPLRHYTFEFHIYNFQMKAYRSALGLLPHWLTYSSVPLNALVSHLKLVPEFRACFICDFSVPTFNFPENLYFVSTTMVCHFLKHNFQLSLYFCFGLCQLKKGRSKQTRNPTNHQLLNWRALLNKFEHVELLCRFCCLADPQCNPTPRHVVRVHAAVWSHLDR